MKIIFLDMDGVLCTPRYAVANGIRGLLDVLDPTCVEFLNRLLDVDPTIEFVISSTWRKIYTSEELLNHMRKAGFKGKFHMDWRTGQDGKGQRGREINEWLNSHPDIEEYLIIDDEVSDIYPYVSKDKVAQTAMYDGILWDHYLRFQKILFGNEHAWLDWDIARTGNKATIPL